MKKLMLFSVVVLAAMLFYGCGKPRSYDLENGQKIELVYIKSGTFMMGSPAPQKNRFGQFSGGEEGRRDNEDQHKVTISKPFWIGKYEITQAQWTAVMGKNPSVWEGANRPVENVSWDDAMEFCKKLNEAYRNKLPKGYEFSLPTEAQWEYACRAGTTGAYAGNLDEMAWYNKNAGNSYEMAWFSENTGDAPHDVGQKKPNAWGLHDMHGNVSEWCYDWYEKNPSSSVTDCIDSSCGENRVFRGGSCGDEAVKCRSAYRDRDLAGCNFLMGFRIALRPVK